MIGSLLLTNCFFAICEKSISRISVKTIYVKKIRGCVKIGTSSYLLFNFSMLRRYRKLQEDMPLLSGEDRGRYFGKRVFYIKTNVIYLPLSPSIFLYLPFISVAFLQQHIPVAFVLAICSPVFHLCVLCAALSYKGGFVRFPLLR